jgi:hypothetical protein
MVTGTNDCIVLIALIALLNLKLSIWIVDMTQTIFAKILNIYLAGFFVFGHGFTSHIIIISDLAGDVKYNRLMTLLYILYSPLHKAIKIGISDVSGRRFASHRTKGWILIKYWWFSERDKARSVETLVLRTLRAKHGPFLDKADMPQGGYTETFDASKVTRKGLIRMVNRAIKDLS